MKNSTSYSQNSEDQVIEMIFSNIGFKSKIFIEFGFDWHENNSRYLLENYGFHGLFIDANIPEGAQGPNGIHFHRAWITRDNINNIISGYYTGEVDFLSIDVDGVDLYLLDCIDIVSPRVVCIEYCASIGKNLSVTVPYKDDFDRHAAHPSGFFCNASLKANINVMKKKGYKFVRSVAGLNAFFVKEDCELKELSCEEGWEPHHSRTYEVHSRWDGTTRAVSPEIQFEWIEDLPWVSVSDKGIIATE